MISRITGKLVNIEENRALVEIQGLTYSVLIASCTSEELILKGRAGEDVTFYTMHYIEGGMGIGNLIPRIAGFLSESDLEFFSILISVQGLSVKKGLKALSAPVGDMARAIETGDVDFLKKLPEIGAKTAQKIIMELKGKTGRFALLKSDDRDFIENSRTEMKEFQSEAVEILVQLQYSRYDAERMVFRTVSVCPGIDCAEDLIQEIFKRQTRGMNGS